MVRHSLINKVGGLAASMGVRKWMGSLSYWSVMYDRSVDPVRSEFRGPVIAVFWHEYMLLPFYLRGNTNTAILTSRHRDANWLSESARHLGFETIRGSTFRGGSQALLEMLRGAKYKNVGIACDGPRGPKTQDGPRSNLPLVETSGSLDPVRHWLREVLAHEIVGPLRPASTALPSVLDYWAENANPS